MPVVRLNVALDERSYPILIGPGALAEIGALRDAMPLPRALVVTNSTVGPLYARKFAAAIENAGISVAAIVELPDGEQYKDWQTLNRIFDALMETQCERETTLIAVGGGVVGDIAGFAAACYQRGMPFIQVPTTLLAQVDSSVGGKTAINHPLGKNMIGAFYQPRLVLADTEVLRTLPDRELSAGLAEVIKYGLIRDRSFIEWLESNIAALHDRRPAALVEAIERSCRHKAAVVAADEREHGQRALLNLGHTFGHAIETGMGYGSWLHGEAVAAGTMMALELSCRLGLISRQEVMRAEKLYRAAGLPVSGPSMPVSEYLRFMQHDKKVRDGRIRFVLIRAIGDAFVSEGIDVATVGEAIAERIGTDQP
jgi:3-dehydroquinate synthase